MAKISRVVKYLVPQIKGSLYTLMLVQVSTVISHVLVATLMCKLHDLSAANQQLDLFIAGKVFPQCIATRVVVFCIVLSRSFPIVYKSALSLAGVAYCLQICSVISRSWPILITNLHSP